MKEQLYTIPVNDAFRSDCECPVCALHRELEQNAIEYTMGPSYMEDDNRAMTDKLGFCRHHIQMLYQQKNRLGLALMLKTHTDKTIRDLKDLSKNKPAASGLFKRSAADSQVGAYIKELESHCFICERMEDTFNRYIDTIFHLWKKDPEFQAAMKECKGFCTYHYGLLYDTGAAKLDKNTYSEFLDCLSQVYFAGMERVNDDIEWFINKYDYRYANEPWKNSKDAIPRGITKTNHIILEE
ncbi:MAG: hypothetical protein IJ648_01535 [Lachnospiraceae bacterium]|nr:hypothetical protein [Lachnospiraceae bacterium]